MGFEAGEGAGHEHDPDEDATDDFFVGETDARRAGWEIRRDRSMVANFCAGSIIRSAQQYCDVGGDGPEKRKMNAYEMHKAAVAATLRLVQIQEEAQDGRWQDYGYMAEEDGPDLVAVVLLRQGESKKNRARTLARQLSHHMMRARVAPELYGADTVICQEIEGHSVREDIADRVQRILTD